MQVESVPAIVLPIDPAGRVHGQLEHAMEEMDFSARAYGRILKVARTMAERVGTVC